MGVAYNSARSEEKRGDSCIGFKGDNRNDLGEKGGGGVRMRRGVCRKLLIDCQIEVNKAECVYVGFCHGLCIIAVSSSRC